MLKTAAKKQLLTDLGAATPQQLGFGYVITPC
jgi:hypothetical protein